MVGRHLPSLCIGSVCFVALAGAASLAWAQADQKSLLESLDGAGRARVFVAMAALILLGGVMLTFVWWGGRMTRRYMYSPRFDNPRPKQTPLYEDDWAEKPLIDMAEDDDASSTVSEG